MATSRRRERELARRRFERRRQAELERRARAKRRNTVIGASVGTVVVIGAVVALVIGLTGGNSKSKVKAGSKPTASPSASSTPAPPAPKKCAKISPDPAAKGEPVIPQVKGKLSKKLVTKDIKVGHGPAAKSGDAVQVKYVGVSCDSGKAFDASYTDPANSTTHKKLLPVTLGQGQVIAGWDQGLIGMKAGGVRELVIPASLGYGPSGSPPTIQGNDTLVFVVTMVKV